ncbi:MAG: hypothetical protein KA436_00060 [Oligoflexales bacterium]|nr:hypothetical protein [Oligoflexales bacterium]
MILRFFLSLVLLELTLSSCQRSGESTLTETRGATSLSGKCSLSAGSYPVQTAIYDRDESLYELTLLNAPPCFPQPLQIESLQLARIDEQTKEKERAKLDYSTEESKPSVLYLVQDYQITLRQKESSPESPSSGAPASEASNAASTPASHAPSFWSPFLAGAAGGIAGGLAGQLIGRAIFDKPQYYAPPPPQAGKSVLGGFGAKSDTPGAIRSYQRKYSGASSPAKVRTFERGSGSSDQTRSSFFKKKNPSPQLAPTRSYSRSVTPKRSFFKTRRR